ncbi:MAG: hypothetical protein O6761_02070, partial [Thaumarchaeota archaeon]|nr:hypothetical protein [Nitrososphaerota archaeon]
NYFKTHTLELAEEYLTTTPDLTISDEFRLRAENIKLRSEKRKYADSDLLQSMQKRIEDLEYGKDARDGFYAKSTLQAKTTMGKVLSTIFPPVFEWGHDEEYKRKFWQEFITARKENRPMNQAAYDLNYIERSDEEKREIYESAMKRLQELEKQSPYKEKIDSQESSGKLGKQKTRYHEERILRDLLLECGPVKI